MWQLKFIQGHIEMDDNVFPFIVAGLETLERMSTLVLTGET